mmetsp:Transcript_3042/g.6099  ORF Transcript_3042/g.6099 Transcript_3042/m.6099 type:complete len:226 (-) Transcript_3042:176-853(-)
MPPLSSNTPAGLNPGVAAATSPSRADARSQRMPPVQYIITRFPLSSCCTSGLLSHPGKSWEFRIFGSMSLAPPGGGAKWPMADSYVLRTSTITVSTPSAVEVSLSMAWYSSASRCTDVLELSSGAFSPERPYPTSSSTLRKPNDLNPFARGNPSVSLKSVSSKILFQARNPRQKSRTACAVPLKVQLRPSGAQRPRPLMPCLFPKSVIAAIAPRCSFFVQRGSKY